MSMRSFKSLALTMLLVCSPGFAADSDEVDFLDLAALMLRDGNLDRALVALDQVDLEAEDTDLLRYYTLRGMTHLRRSENEAASDALERAIETRSAESIVYVYLAQAYFSREMYREVLSTLDRAGNDLDSVASIHHLRAQCHWLLDEPGLAIGTLDRASAIFPEDTAFLRRKVFFLMNLGLFQEAAEQGAVYLQRSEGSIEDFVAMGNAMRASGELDAAALLLEEARLRYPGDGNVNKVLAHTYLDMGRTNAAADLVMEAALTDPALIGEAAELYRRAGRLNRALMLNSQVVDQEAKLKQRLALLLELQRFEQAAAMDDALVRTGLLTDEDIRYAIAYAFFKTGDFDRSEEHLQALQRPDLFRKAAELRSAMQECAEDSWRCM